MSIGSLGMIGSLASTSQSQRVADVEKVERETTDQARRSEGQAQAEVAAGIGQTEEESEVADRDADGRRPWEFPGHPAPEEASEEALPPAPIKDPHGDAGTVLDVSG